MTTDSALFAEVRAFREKHPDVRYVDLLCLDIPGHFYGKRYPIEMLEKVAAGSDFKLPQNCVLLGAQGGVYEIADYAFNDGDPDALRRLVPGTLVPVNWEHRPMAQMLVTSDGTDNPIEFEPREVLRKVVERLHSKGIYPVTAFELEFYLFEAELQDGLPQFPRDILSGDSDDQAAYHIHRLSRFSEVMEDIAETAREQGIDTTVITAELGPGQFEINFSHCEDPIRAADWSALFCRATRGVALKHGYRASFMSKPYLDHPGSGLHIHVSLYDKDGNNLLVADNHKPLRHAVNGCLTSLPELMAIYAPNHNAYRRFGAVNSAKVASWGYEDRDACVRIPESDEKNLRLEFRLPGADANPYLALAALLVSIERGLEEQQEPIVSLNEDRSSGIAFPGDMLEAVRAMRHSEVANQGLGSEFVMVYCENKRYDHEEFMRDINAREYRWYM